MATKRRWSKLPDSIPLGKEIADTQENNWSLDEVINAGRFATVYLAAGKKEPEDFDYAVKVEYHENGPLFTEIRCYQNIAKPVDLSDWVKKKKLRYLGLSPCHGFGSFEHKGSKFRFLVIQRFGIDLQKILEESNRIFPVKTVCLIGLSVIDVLEYIHSCGYIHGDVKAANLLLGRHNATDQVYLVDMGLACKYLRGGIHKPDVTDPEYKSHNGTPEFISRDAHRGTFSRRSDLETFSYNLLRWLTGRLPWEDYINDSNKLHREKEKCMTNIDYFLKTLFHREKCPCGISKLLEYISVLSFEEEPNYDYCRKLLKDVLKSAGYSSSDYTMEFTIFRRVPKKTLAVPLATTNKPVLYKENDEIAQIPKWIQAKDAEEFNEFEEGMVLTPEMQAVLNKTKKNVEKSIEFEEGMVLTPAMKAILTKNQYKPEKDLTPAMKAVFDKKQNQTKKSKPNSTKSFCCIMSYIFFIFMLLSCGYVYYLM